MSALPIREKQDEPVRDGVSSSDSSVDLENELVDEDDQDDDDYEQFRYVSLFAKVNAVREDADVFPSAEAMLAACRAQHDFDFATTYIRLGLDFHGAVKLLNFVRKSAQDDKPLPTPITLDHLSDDSLYRPILEDDGFLLTLDETLTRPEFQAQAAGQLNEELVHDLVQQNRALQEQLEALTSQFDNYRQVTETTLNKRWGIDDADDEKADSKFHKGKPANHEKGETDYFESYAHNDIHETMLKDTVRTDAYRDFVYQNKHIFQGKTVLDIGCGTGILSMFCAKAGATQVLAVDNSAIITKARENIAKNGLGDVITCLSGRIEEVQLPVDQVDVIISEWMGYCLLFEAMLPSVLWARDKYLKPDGILAPSVATMWVAPVADEEYVADAVTFWDDVYGFDMTAMKTSLFRDSRIDVLPGSSVAGKPALLKRFDLHETKLDDLQFTTSWASQMTRQDAAKLDGFIVWFDIFFTAQRSDVVRPHDAVPETWTDAARGQVAFTTGPHAKPTHWKQTVLLLDETNARAPEAAEPVATGTAISGEFVCTAQTGDERALEVRLKWTVDGRPSQRQTWLV